MRHTIIAIAFAFSACGQAPRPLEPENRAAAVLSFRMALPAGVAPAQVETAHLRVSAPDMDTLEAPLAVAGSELVGELVGVPAGADRNLEVIGEDAAGRRVLSGSLRVDVEAGGRAILAVSLQRVGRVGLDATFDTTLFD